MTKKRKGGEKMDAWDNNTMPAGQADNDALMAQIRESLLANLGQTIDAICKGTMQQMAKASRMSAENTVLWVVDRICRQTLDRHPGDTDFVYEQADIFVNALFGQPNVSLQVLQRINDMKAEALKTRQQMEQEAHLRDIELRKAGGQQMQNVQNLFGSNSVKGEGNMNVGGGSISM